MTYNPNFDAAMNVDELVEYTRMLKSAPITVFADTYFNGNLDLAVQKRIDYEVNDALRNDDTIRVANVPQNDMEVTVHPVTPQGNLRGFASIKFGNITIHDFKIVENKNGNLFVSLPSKPDKSSETGYRNTVQIDKGFKAAFDEEVIRKYYSVGTQHRAEAKQLPTTGTPTLFSDKLEKARNEAALFNAERHPREPGFKNRAQGR